MIEAITDRDVITITARRSRPCLTWPPKPRRHNPRSHVRRWLLVAQCKALRLHGATQMEIALILDLPGPGVAGRYYRMPLAVCRDG